MSGLGYITRCIRKMSFGSLFETVGEIHKKSGKNSIGLFFDIIHCGLKYGAGYKDYSVCEWYNLNSKQRKTFITRGINNSIIKKYNDPNYYHLLKNKADFNQYFAEYIGRKQMDITNRTPEEFAVFMQGLETIVAKPLAENCGKGVIKLNKSDFASTDELYDKIKASNSLLVEECIVQHEKMSSLYPHSVNTMRIITIIGRDNKPHIVFAALRMGNNGKVVDNLSNGGMAAPIDIATGTITKVAFDKDFNYYEKHPQTGTEIIGFTIPEWEKAKQLVIDAAKTIPQIRYIGWDVAMTSKGSVMVEGNQHPGHHISQLPPHVENKTGMLPRYKELLDI